MAFSIEIWRDQINQKLHRSRDWLERLKTRQAPYVTYGFLSTLALWPLLEALGAGQVFPVMNALGLVAGDVGGNLLANRIEAWRQQADRLTEAELETLVEQEVAANPELREALDALLEKLEVIPETTQALPEPDRQWFVETLRQELATLGSLKRLEASLTGAGVIIQDSKLKGGDRSIVGSQAEGDIITGDHNVIIKGQPKDIRSLYRSYLHRTFKSCSYLALSGVDRAAAGETEATLNLNAVYTALLTQTPEAHEQMLMGEKPDRETGRLSALAQMDRHPYLVLLGDPGSGKSTFVDFVSMCLAGELLKRPEANLTRLTEPLPDDEGQSREERQPWSHEVLLPVRVILREFAARGLPPVGEVATAKTLWRFIVAELSRDKLEGFIAPLEQILRKEGGLLLLDGLDEVPEAGDRREQIKQAVEGFRDVFPACRILVTSRIYAYQKQAWRLTDFEVTTLAPFSQGQIRRFIDRWYEHMSQLQRLSGEDAQAKAELLKQTILRNPRLQELAERPLLLTLIASLHAWRSGSLPDRREELYDDAVELLLYWWERPKVVRDQEGQLVTEEPGLMQWLEVDQNKLRRLLNELAYEAHAEQPHLRDTADIDEDKLAGRLMRLSSAEKNLNPVELRNYLSNRAGLLVPRGVGVYTFPHRTFQEYLAACHLTDKNYPYELVRLVREEPNRWREVVLLAGAKSARGSISAMWSLVDRLCPRGPTGQAEEADLWAAHLAGQSIVETPDWDQFVEYELDKVERVRTWLVYILEKAALPAVERARAGQVLARLGDPRPGVGLRKDGLPDIAWREVPEGAFVRGSQDDSLSLEKETPQQQIVLPAFRISLYPVTNRQYMAFVEDGGYTDRWRSCWTEAGWEWKKDRAGPNRYGGEFDLPNHPVVGVTWYEAVAFCNWLTQRLRQTGELGPDQAISLPSESQWEKATRGPDGRQYPWGDEPDPERANYDDTGIGRTTAVGCFPGGASPYEVQDMSGNVWEWCRTRFEESYEDYQDDNDLAGSGRRVLRGGSFFRDNRDVRCAVRGEVGPGDRGTDLGFRVLLAPFFNSEL